MNYGEIKKYDIANGEGVRVSLFVSGCTHHCKNCFNFETWDFNYGKPFTKETEDEIIDSLSHDYIDGLTLIGGERLNPKISVHCCLLLKKLKRSIPTKPCGVIPVICLIKNCSEKAAQDASVPMKCSD